MPIGFHTKKGDLTDGQNVTGVEKKDKALGGELVADLHPEDEGKCRQEENPT